MKEEFGINNEKKGGNDVIMTYLEFLKKVRQRFYELYVNVDMVNGFCKFGPMSCTDYLELVPEQKRMYEKFIDQNQPVDDIREAHLENAREFRLHPDHCVIGTQEAETIDELKEYQTYKNYKVYGKNSINGIFVDGVKNEIDNNKDLQLIVFEGVCIDYCVLELALAVARYLDQINRDITLVVVWNAVDTYDAPDHNREEWFDISRKLLERAGVVIVENFEEFEEKERQILQLK